MMKVCSLYGASASYDNGLGIVMKIIYSTLSELGVETEEINLIEYNIPYFMGMKTEPVRVITEIMKNCDSVIFATPSQLFQPSAIMKCLLDYFEMDEYKKLLEGKNCMIVTIANKYGEKEASDYMSRIISLLGGNEAVRIAFGGGIRASLGQSSFIQEIIEKHVEDYYRAFKQNKKYFINSESEYFSENSVNQPTMIPSSINAPTIPSIQQPPTMSNSIQNETPQISNPFNIAKDNQNQQIAKPNSEQKSIFNEINEILGSISTLSNAPQELIVEQPYQQPTSTPPPNIAPTQMPNLSMNTNKKVPSFQSLNLDSFTSRQEEDIQELAKLFSQKVESIESNVQANNNITYSNNFNSSIVPRTKSIKQLTFSLPHYFQPHLATDVNAVIQINITGNEVFECNLSIHGSDCKCTEGVFLTPDLTILSNTSVWGDLLKGKYSAQKAFMTGQLKVRGDFLLLNKFDQLFKKM